MNNNEKNKIRVGYIDYLNCFPLYSDYFSRDNSREYNETIELVSSYPAELNRLMNRGELLVSPISSALYAENQDKYLILPEFCISASGSVKSVLLISKYPLEDLNHKKIGLSSASKTSVILLKIILNSFYNLQPYYVDSNPEPVINLEKEDGKLIIGNKALQYKKSAGEYLYDLGEIWKRVTGHPMVYALIAIKRDGVSENIEALAKYTTLLRKSINRFERDFKEVSKDGGDKYKNIDVSAEEYYSVLKYRFSHRMKDALRFYYDQGAAAGLLPTVDRINYYL